MVLLDRIDARIGCDRGSHVSLVEPDLFRNQLALIVAASFYLYDQPTQNVCDSIFFAAAKEASVGLNAGSVCQENLVIHTAAVTYGEGVGVAPDDDAFKLHLRATRNSVQV